MYKIHALTPLNKDYPAFNRFDGITISEVNDLSLVILMKRLEPQKDFYKLAKMIFSTLSAFFGLTDLILFNLSIQKL